MTRYALLAVAAAVLLAASYAGAHGDALDVSVTAKKLIILDKTAAAGRAKVVFVAKDGAIEKGPGELLTAVSVDFDFAYHGPGGSVGGSFTLPAGASDGTRGWKVNSASVAKYVNKEAPLGETGAKVGVIKPAKLLKLVGKTLGDQPIDILSGGAPDAGGVDTRYSVTNGSEVHHHCSNFEQSDCAYKQIAGGSGAKLVCKNGEGAVCGEEGECPTTNYDSTWAAIQGVIFNAPVYGCSNVVCHGGSPGQGNLDLTDANAYANLVGVPSSINPPIDRVEPGDHTLSVLFDKLRAGSTMTLPAFGGSPMPSGGTPLTPDHLEAIELWIRGGAPEDLVVDGTAELLATCLPEPDPLVIDPPDPPGAGVGVQVRQTPWPLPAESEDEICMATYYDFTATGLVPESAKISCALGGANNPSGECFQWHTQKLVQDPQSHHSIIHLYTGSSDTTDAGWGNWTRKFQDDSDPQHGTACSPTAVDPATGYAPNCSGAVTPSIACIGYGPPDASILFSNGFSGSQEPFYEQEFADGAYSILPMAGIIIWNSHAFNTTTTDSTMSQYLNLEFAGPLDQSFPVKQIFDIDDIFIMDVPPFETREYCATYVIPQNTNHFQVSSHTHRHGVHFRVYEPPNSACTSGDISNPGNCQPGSAGQLLYESFEYADPAQLNIDPPVAYGAVSASNRRFKFCSKYDNGSAPTSPLVKTNSNPLGGCAVSKRACMDGPNKGVLCGGNDAFCDTTPGAGDGLCDACPVVGGVTTEDEMFVLIGLFY